MMNDILIDEVYTGDSNAADGGTVNNSIHGCYTNGVRLHIIDIFMEELVTASSSTTETTTSTSTSLESSSSKLLKTDTFLKCIESYMEVACCQIPTIVQMSVCNSIILCYLEDYSLLPMMIAMII